MQSNSYKIFWSVLVLAAGIALNMLGSRLIGLYAPDRPIPPDLFFTYVPYLGWTQYASDIANVFSVAILAVYIFSGRFRLIPMVLMTFGLAEVMRGLIILLNPLGSPLGPEMRYGVTNFVAITQYGQFPSGHTMVVVLSYFLVDWRSAPSLKALMLFSVVVEMVALIASRGHYSIDIVGGFLIAYVAFHEVKKREQWLTLKPNQ